MLINSMINHDILLKPKSRFYVYLHFMVVKIRKKKEKEGKSSEFLLAAYFQFLLYSKSYSL